MYTYKITTIIIIIIIITIIRFLDCPSPQRMGAQRLYSEGPDPLLCAGSRASRTKISDIPTRLNDSVIFVAFIHSLVFSLRGRAGRNQSPVM